MRLKDFDFRVWHKPSRSFVEIKSSFLTTNGRDEIVFDRAYNVPIDDENVEIELWTGLVDKKGKRIYDGDIVKVGLREEHKKEYNLIDSILLIEFNKKDMFEFDEFKTFGFAFMGNDDKQGKAIHTLNFWGKVYNYQHCEIQILGNIHENAELLKELG